MRRVSSPRFAVGSAIHSVRRPSGPVRILFVSANPGDRDQLVLEEEYRAIEQRIRRARHRDAFRLIVCPAARRSDLQDALLEHAPHVVHFACHGSRQGALSLLGENPTSAPVSTESLAAMFEVANDQLLLVVFNACFASIQAAAIRPFAKATIGMRAQVTDRASIAFASALYGALAYGRSVQQAFALGVAAIVACVLAAVPRAEVRRSSSKCLARRSGCTWSRVAASVRRCWRSAC